MAKKNSIISLIFILLSLFSFIQTIDPINVNVDTDDVNWLEYYKEDRNEPANVVNAVYKIAELKNMDVETVDEVTTNNARKIFKI